ncbi:MAG: threonine ammonia-lyase [Desulfosarcina sp.]|nr:threonine ammonia-lyase [Desulfobacterales bacterium]
MLTIADIYEADRRIRDRILRTPLVFSPAFSQMFAGQIYLKMENLQKTGSFKIRGALNPITAHRDHLPPLGVVAASAGNHAQGVALAARWAGVAATIIMPQGDSVSKQEATLIYRGRVVLQGQTVSDSIDVALKLAREGRTFIHPFDDPLIIAGQGTVALEIMEDLPEVDTILVPVGGGGFMAGIALAAKELRPAVRIIGVEAAACPSASAALKKQHITTVPSRASIADGINVRQIGQLPFEIIRDLADEIVCVDENRIAAAILLLMERKKIVAEGAGAVPLAALMGGAVTLARGQKTVLLISGGNLDSPLLGRIISRGLSQSGRIMRAGVERPDVPGALARLLDVIAGRNANVLHIYHNRSRQDLPINITVVELEMETRGDSHVAEVEQALRDAGYELNSC